MDIQNPALVGIFVGMAWALIRVVEYFVKKYRGDNKVYLVDEHFNLLKDIHEQCSLCGRFGPLTTSQTQSLENIEKISNHLDNLHSVFDDNHVPKWYFPKEMMKEIKTIHNDIGQLSLTLRNEFVKLSSGQSVSIEKMSELINAQKLITERLGDLVVLWTQSLNKTSNK